jgi:hypothetical protein
MDFDGVLMCTVGAFSVPLEFLSGLNKSSTTGDYRLVGSEPDSGVGRLLEGAHQGHCLISCDGVNIENEIYMAILRGSLSIEIIGTIANSRLSVAEIKHGDTI